MSLLLTGAIGASKAQVVYLDNTHTNCDYKLKVFYAEGDCHQPNNFFICTGTQSSVLLTVTAGNSVTYYLPPNTGACKYEVYDGSFTLVAACNTSSSPYYCNAVAFTDCESEHRYVDFNSGCEGVNAGTVKIY